MSLIRRGPQCLVYTETQKHTTDAADMINIFEVFLPQLLRYPNPCDPLNGEAAALLMREPKTYEMKVRDYVTRYATKEIAEGVPEDTDNDEMSSVGTLSSDEPVEPAGALEV